jgi:glutathione peroxidase
MRAPTPATLLLFSAFSVACTSMTAPQPQQQSGGDPPPSGTSPPGSGTSIPVDPGPEPDWPANTSCTGQPGEIYEFKVKRLFEGDEYPLCAFKGRVLLIVNGASYCGYTYHYGPLQKDLYAKYKTQGFSVLAFPSKSFNQEGDTAEEISSNCLTEYNVKFPVFAIGNVNPPNEQPVYTWLKAPAQGATGAIPWNFEKFLISRTGQVVKRFAYTIDPDPAKDPQIENAIKAELAK